MLDLPTLQELQHLYSLEQMAIHWALFAAGALVAVGLVLRHAWRTKGRRVL